MNNKRPIDQNVRDEILISNHDHYLINASAGSGKTTILVDKCFSLIEKQEINPYQQILLITFTRLATRQLKEKISNKLIRDELLSEQELYNRQLAVLTTEGFVISKIIKPFVREAYGKHFPKSDEIQENYHRKFSNFEEGIRLLKENKILGSYENDIKKNFMYELGYRILLKSGNARKYIQAKYPYIMVDEYQDVDLQMHKLYMYLQQELKIKLFLVGDIKQLIFDFRGADEEIFNELKNNESFVQYNLIHNFRSHMSIVKFSYYFFDEDFNFDEVDDNEVYFYRSNDFNSAVNKVVDSYKDEEIAYLYARKGIWEQNENLLRMTGFELVEDLPLNTGHPNYYQLEPLLKLYFNTKNYNVYNVLDDLRLNPNIKNKSEIKKIMAIFNSNCDDYNEAFERFEKLLDIILDEEGRKRFLETLDDRYRINFVMEDYKKVALTIHKSKGLEFDHVFINADSFYNWADFKEKNHYVAITRPRKSLHIVLNERYCRKLENIGIDYKVQTF